MFRLFRPREVTTTSVASGWMSGVDRLLRATQAPAAQSSRTAAIAATSTLRRLPTRQTLSDEYQVLQERSTGIRRQAPAGAKCSGSVNLYGIRGDHPLVPERAVLGDALLGCIVDPNDPEPLRVAVRPLEVVQQRPDEVAGQWHPSRERPVGHGEVVAE